MAPRSVLIAALLGTGAPTQPLEALSADPVQPTQGSGARLRARVVGPDGAPLEGLRPWVATPGGIADEAVCGLLRRASRETDAEGWIERQVPGPGTYTLLPDPHSGPWPPWILPPSDVPTDGEALLVARFARVRIRAVDRLGDPVEDGDSFCVRVGGEVWSWNREAVRESGTATLDPDAVLIHSATRPWRESEPHTWIARPGHPYVCGWFSPSRGLVERRVELADDAHEREVTFVLGDPAPPSSLVVDLGSGTGGRPDLPVEVHVESTACGAVLTGQQVRGSEGVGRSLRFDLPAGRYLVTVVPAPVDAGHGTILPPEAAGPRAIVDIGLGDHVRRQLRLARGSRLTLELRASAGALDPRVSELVGLESGFTEMAAVSGWLPSRLWGRVWFRPEGGVPRRRLRFFHPGVRMTIAGVLPGSSATSFERLAPGRHVLSIECAGFEPAEVELEAVDGRDVEVALDLVPVRR